MHRPGQENRRFGPRGDRADRRAAPAGHNEPRGPNEGEPAGPEWRRPGPAGAIGDRPRDRGRGGRGGGRANGALDDDGAVPGAAAARPFRGRHRGGRHDGRWEQRRDGSVDSNASQSNSRNAPRNPPREIGFKKLEELSVSDGVTIMEKLADESTLNLFEKLTCEKQLREDWIRLVVTILSKVCQVEYKPIINRLFDKIFQKQFVDQLILHITYLSDDTNNKRKKTVGDFFNQLCILSKSLLELNPNLACEHLETVLKRSFQELEELEGHEDVRKEIKFLREKLKIEKERLESMKAAAPKPGRGKSSFPMTPQINFRELSHFPTIDDIVVSNYAKPFIRPNKVDLAVHGSYANVDDYLDTHFRLMREDFTRPLREGILDYRRALEEKKNTNNKKMKRVQNIRIYEKVKIVQIKTQEEKVGLLLNFDPEKKMASKIKWEYSKRLMTGNLLVLSTDEDFSSIVLVTVSKRDPKELLEGRILVELCEDVASIDLLNRQFLMVECQVYFGAYSHVLKSLKNFNEETFPMSDYIVYGSTAEALPDYQIRALDAHQRFQLLLKSNDPSSIGEGVFVDIDNFRTWPSAAQLGLDDSQYQALRGALTNKLMLIQGPPGTGKTFIGLKIGACLMKNEELWRPKEDRRPMLVVCYTNHALDQFLTGLLSVTNSIIRVGWGSKEPRLEQHGINFLRMNNSARPANLRTLYQNIRQQKKKFSELQHLGDRVRSCSSLLKESAAGIVSLKTLCAFGIVPPQFQALSDLDILKWLCGLGYDERLPTPLEQCLSEDVVDLKDPAFSHLKFSTEGMLKVTMSVSLRKLGEQLAEPSNTEDTLEDENLKLKNIMDSLKREIATTEYPRYPDHRHHPRPAQIWQLNNMERWQLYRFWRDSLIAILDVDLRPLLAEIDTTIIEVSNLLSSWRMVEDQHIMSDFAIIGMTTSFAASRQQILKELKPRIVIVEEAAEVFESHVVVSLAGAVEHLIMIGDHQQLRPNPSVHELGVKYHLNVSLFERLIKNGVQYVTLSTQHRMRPEVAKLISPCIYPNLINHPSVQTFPAVPGVSKNVFFVDHQRPEEEDSDAQSYRNSHEAKFVSCLVKYLLLQGYDPSRITVLSTYKGQQYYFSKIKQHQAHLKDVRITVVDNFQGEESDVILLSLVRSNAEDAVGFLKTENRVCVALSRARHGLYIIGNMANMTATDTVWRKVQEELRRQDAIGPALSLHCDRHGVVTPVSKAEDFAGCPQGGCLQLCRTLMSCGHDCKQVCHIQDMEHKTARCTEQCLRPACPQQHLCPQRCYVKCPPCLVPKVVKLRCGHSERMPCHRDPADHKCQAVVTCTLPACGHEREAACHQLARLDALPCTTPCTRRMLCGHTCRSNCHVLDDPNHEKVKCMQPCGQKRLGCSAEPGHGCRLMCHQPCEECTVPVEKTLACGHPHNMKCNGDVTAVRCERGCERTLPCGHKCKKKCCEECQPCGVQVCKTLPGCGHVVKMSCGTSAADFRNCKELCQRLLPCGHRCSLKCGQDCATGRCKQLVPYPGVPACGHTISVPCHLKNTYSFSSPELLALCRHPCPTLLEPCKHQCGGSCGTCLQGRFHQPCQSKCERRLLCGHLCKEACPMLCPPCTQPCEQACVHSSCNHRCGIPCVQCKEPCRRRCEHGRCPGRCGDQCTFECSEPCRKKVKACGHDCIGLCGDPCICRECNEEEVTTIFFGTEEDEGARFVKLPDCGHIIESSSLDDWMSVSGSDNEKPSEIKPKLCPKCTAPIKSCQRYSNVMKKVAIDIAVVKAKSYDTKTIQLHLDKVKEILKNMAEFPLDYPAVSSLVSKASRYLDTVRKKMPKGRQTGTRKVPPLSISEAQNLEQKVLILKSLGQVVSDVDKLSTHGMAEFKKAVELLCSSLMPRDLVRLSEQEAADITMELERLQRLVQLLQVENGNSFRQLQTSDKTSHANVSRILRGLSPYSKDVDAAVSRQLEHLAKVSSATITRQELDAIVAAFNMRAGRWFRCPNGHPYIITECGGATQEAICPEEGCGARIGGGNHQVRSDNTFAPDIDGAVRPAYDTTNNLPFGVVFDD